MLLRLCCFFGLLLISVGAHSADLIDVYEAAATTNPQLAAAEKSAISRQRTGRYPTLDLNASSNLCIPKILNTVRSKRSWYLWPCCEPLVAGAKAA